jgi:ribose transport system ATP-binding protein
MLPRRCSSRSAEVYAGSQIETVRAHRLEPTLGLLRPGATGTSHLAANVMSDDLEPILSFRGVTKRFGGTLAVHEIDLDIHQGQVHALLGANGAGKSTLIKLLAGVHEPDSGGVYLRGHRIDHVRPRPPMAFIHQDLGLIEWMTVSENIALVEGFPKRHGFIDWRAVEREAVVALRALGSGIDCSTSVSRLPRTERSIVAIARALAINSDVLVLDEPTASLPETETARLFDVLHRLRTRGVAIIYVTHRLDEVFRLADTVTVLRDGMKVRTCPVAATTPSELVQMIVGRPPADVFVTPPESRAASAIQVHDLRVGRVGPVSFDVKAGEIVGLAGLRGAGQNAIGRAISGLETIAGGSITLRGRALTLSGPSAAIEAGIRFVTSNREAEGLALPLTVTENLFLNPGALGRQLWAAERPRSEQRRAAQVIKKFSVRPNDPTRVITTLSGGNQQKVMLARWLGQGGRLLVLEEPTMGVDVGAKADIYEMLSQELASGVAALLVSSDLDEVAGICHRALIFNRGRIVDEVQRQQLSAARLMALVGGANGDRHVPMEIRE